MTPELLQFYAACYTDDPKSPLCSPLFGDLTRPAAVAFVRWRGTRSCSMIRACSIKSCSIPAARPDRHAPERWHAYVLYYLNENMSDFAFHNQAVYNARALLRFLAAPGFFGCGQRHLKILAQRQKRRNWFPIFPPVCRADGRRHWACCAAALDNNYGVLQASIAVRLRRGVFCCSRVTGLHQKDKEIINIHIPV